MLDHIGDIVLGASEASIAVLLVLAFGYILQHQGYVTVQGEKQISYLCVNFFLPALLFTQIGPHATFANLRDYASIVIFSVLSLVLSYIVSTVFQLCAKSPGWTVPAFMFQNSVSLPLLLVDSLENTGVIETIIGPHGGDVHAAVERGRAYILISALVIQTAGFAFGPGLIYRARRKVSNESREPLPPVEASISQLSDQPPGLADECTPLLPSAERISAPEERYFLAAYLSACRIRLAKNPPLTGAAAALFCGLIPPVSRALFENRAFLASTLTQSISFMGKLYTPLQIFVLGCKLHSSSGHRAPLLTVVALFIHRFFLVPLVVAALVFSCRKAWPDFAQPDPMLDFVLYIMAAGPPAVTLAAVSRFIDACFERYSY
ncbi:hypothetical protein BDV93DRAFT_3921 [Ceratobasidium sp. AG-I]|nr:hypothetical protein BDV93DRAFT_3921 [Ceratobasidium sp. AG-I]